MTTTTHRSWRIAAAALAVLALGLAPTLSQSPAAQAAPPCDYNNKVYCDGGDEPAWQWDTIDDVACVQIPGAFLDANDKPVYTNVIGKVYYKGALVWDSTPKPKPKPKPAAPKPAAPKPAAPVAAKPAAKPTTSKPVAASATPTPTPTPTATAEPRDTDIERVSVDSDGIASAAPEPSGPNPGLFVLGGVVVAGAAAVGVYALRRRRLASSAEIL